MSESTYRSHVSFALCMCLIGLLSCESQPVQQGDNPLVYEVDLVEDASSAPKALSPSDLNLARERAPRLAAESRAALRQELGLPESDDLKIDSIKVDPYGRTHTRARLTHHGLPVVGGYVTTIHSPTGELLPRRGRRPDSPADFAVETEPQLSAQDVTEIILLDLAPATPLLVPKPKLCLRPERTAEVRPEALGKETLNAADMVHHLTGYRLVYAAMAHVRSDKHGAHDVRYEIDAQTGELLDNHDALPRSGDMGGDWVALEPTVKNGHSQYSGEVQLNVTDDTEGESGEFHLIDPGRGSGHSRIRDWTKGNVVWNIDRRSLWSVASSDRDPTTNELFVTLEGPINTYASEDNDWGNGENYGPFDAEDGITTTSPRGETAAVDAFFGTMVTWDLFKNVFGISGIDGEGSAMGVVVHHGTSRDTYWDPVADLVLLPDPGDLDQPNQGTALDTVGHEFGHGLFFHSMYPDGEMSETFLEHEYWGEYGGIVEAHADIIGAMVEFYATTFPYPGDYIPNTGGNWVLGDKVPSGSRRYMYRPSLDGHGFNEWAPERNTPAHSPHDMAGPINRMFYFLSQGAQPFSLDPMHGTARFPGGFAGLGNQRAAHIWFNVIAYELYPGAAAPFMDLREKCVGFAAWYYGEYSEEHLAVMDAFAAVNIGEPADRSPPEITIIESRTSTYVTLQVELADASPIVNASYTMSGQNHYGDALGFGNAYTDPGSGFSITLPMSQVQGFTLNLSVSATDELGMTSSKTHVLDVTRPHCGVATWKTSVRGRHGQLEASDDRGLTRAEMYIDGNLQSTLHLKVVPGSGGVDAHTFDFYYSLAYLETGVRAITYRVYDSSGNVCECYGNQYVDNTVPEFNSLYVIPMSLGGSGLPTVRGNVKLQAHITDDSNVEVLFRIDGVGDVCTDVKTSTHTANCYPFDTTTLTEGVHQMGVHATDIPWGNGDSAYFSFVVDNIPDTQPPDPGDPPSSVVCTEATENNDNIKKSCSANADELRGGYSHSYDLDQFVIPIPAGKCISIASTYTCSNARLSLIEDEGGSDENWWATARVFNGDIDVTGCNSSSDQSVPFTVSVAYLGSCLGTYRLMMDVH
jgi:Zn-dependent metalloprotease